MLDLRNIDCFELLSQTGNNTIDLVLTDPPYGMNFQSNARKVKYDKIQNDENLDWLSIWVDELRRVVKSDSHLYIWCSWHNIEKFKIEISRQFKIKNVIIWSKGGGGMGDLNGGYGGTYEMCIFVNNGKALIQTISILHQNELMKCNNN